MLNKKPSITHSSLKGTARADSDLKRHIIMLEKRLDEKDKQVAELEKTTVELKKEPRVNNQVLQVISITPMDNYLDMLTHEFGNFDQALEYIKDCALSDLSGDCQLIEKIYVNKKEQTNICFVDKSRNKIQYFNEEKKIVVDSKELFGKKIANNIQNSYLKGINYLINQNLNNNLCPNKFLEEYDLQIWNQHIYDLSDLQYHRKIVNHLNLPFK